MSATGARRSHRDRRLQFWKGCCSEPRSNSEPNLPRDRTTGRRSSTNCAQELAVLLGVPVLLAGALIQCCALAFVLESLLVVLTAKIVLHTFTPITDKGRCDRIVRFVTKVDISK